MPVSQPLISLIFTYLCATSTLATDTHPTGASCEKTYVASRLERKWMKHIAKWESDEPGWTTACQNTKADGPLYDKWLELNKKWPESTAGFTSDIYSHHEIKCSNGRSGRVYIEPLAVALRNPRWPCHGGNAMDVDYLLMPRVMDRPYEKAYFFDLGTGRYTGPTPGQGDNLKWLVEAHERNGINFTSIFGWEKVPMDHDKYWKEVPSHLKPRFHLYNTACSDDVDSDMNPLSYIASVATPNDYVGLKIDIDNNELEVNLVNQILASPHLSSLIDDIFWENHVTGNPMQAVGWGYLKGITGPVKTMHDSYTIFTKLRKAGIRAHSWV